MEWEGEWRGRDDGSGGRGVEGRMEWGRRDDGSGGRDPLIMYTEHGVVCASMCIQCICTHACETATSKALPGYRHHYYDGVLVGEDLPMDMISWTASASGFSLLLLAAGVSHSFSSVGSIVAPPARSAQAGARYGDQLRCFWRGKPLELPPKISRSSLVRSSAPTLARGRRREDGREKHDGTSMCASLCSHGPSSLIQSHVGTLFNAHRLCSSPASSLTSPPRHQQCVAGSGDWRSPGT